MEGSQKYSPSEVSLHSSKKGCWLIIHGKVYDVTTFLEDHPGGEDVLLHASASGDATQSFEEVGHSSTATSLMQGYLIGVLDGSAAFVGAAGGAAKAKESAGVAAEGAEPLLQERKPPSSSFFDILLPVIVLGLAFGAWYYLTYYQPQA